MSRSLGLGVLVAGLALTMSTVPAVADEAPQQPTVQVTGTPAVGQTLTASTPDWDAEPAATYRWTLDDGTQVGVQPRLTVAPEHCDHALTVTASGSMSGTATQAQSTTLRILCSAAPSIVGTYLVGSTLTAVTDGWSDETSYTYQWYAGSRRIAKATARTLRLTTGLGKQRISVRVTGSKAGFAPVVRASRTSAKVFTAAATPKVVGTPATGRRLSVKRGTWMKGARFGYQWYADGSAVRGANRSTLTLDSGLARKQLSVRVTGVASGFERVSRTSGRSLHVQKIGRPSLHGSPRATSRMSVSPGTWASGTRFTYRWTLNGKKVSSSRSVTVKAGWKGKRLKATVTGRQRGYKTFTVSTKRSSAVKLPGRTDPVSSWKCPSWAPIKGNASSMIYHMPGQRFYSRTKPEDCFSSQSAARKAGYRKAKV